MGACDTTKKNPNYGVSTRCTAVLWPCTAENLFGGEPVRRRTCTAENLYGGEPVRRRTCTTDPLGTCSAEELYDRSNGDLYGGETYDRSNGDLYGGQMYDRSNGDLYGGKVYDRSNGGLYGGEDVRRYYCPVRRRDVRSELLPCTTAL